MTTARTNEEMQNQLKRTIKDEDFAIKLKKMFPNIKIMKENQKLYDTAKQFIKSYEAKYLAAEQRAVASFDLTNMYNKRRLKLQCNSHNCTFSSFKYKFINTHIIEHHLKNELKKKTEADEAFYKFMNETFDPKVFQDPKPSSVKKKIENLEKKIVKVEKIMKENKNKTEDLLYEIGYEDYLF